MAAQPEVIVDSRLLNDLDWLVGLHFESLANREYDWTLSLRKSAIVRIECLWRLTEAGRIVVTSQDEGHMFGLPAPVDAAELVNVRLINSAIEAVRLEEGTLDLSLAFDTGHVLQLLPDSSGYEAWEIGSGNDLYVAAGGGKLAIFHDR